LLGFWRWIWKVDYFLDLINSQSSLRH
jgi:hypothetical protein